jgi:hypothetical protein
MNVLVTYMPEAKQYGFCSHSNNEKEHQRTKIAMLLEFMMYRSTDLVVLTM